MRLFSGHVSCCTNDPERREQAVQKPLLSSYVTVSHRNSNVKNCLFFKSILIFAGLIAFNHIIVWIKVPSRMVRFICLDRKFII